MYISILSDKDLLNIWVEAAVSWAVEPYHDLGNAGDEEKLRIGLYYGLSGGGELYMHRDELQIDTSFIAAQMNASMMWMFGYSEKEIKRILKRSVEMFDDDTVELYHKYCEENILWLIP